MKKRFILYCLPIFIVFSCQQSEYDYDLLKSQLISENQKQALALKKYINLHDYIKEESTSRSPHTSNRFPDYYGGAFINDENELVVLLKEEEAATSEAINLKTSMESLKYQLCEHSYNELKELLDNITHKLSTSDSIAQNICMLGIDEMKNRVVIFTSGNIEESEMRFKHDIIDSPMLTFRQVDNSDFDVAIKKINNQERIQSPMRYSLPGEIKYGQQIIIKTSDTTYSNATLGYCVGRSLFNRMYLTAGHAGSVGDTVYNKWWEPIGIITESKYNESKVDAALITPFEDIVSYGKLANFDNLELSIDTLLPPVGYQVAVCGKGIEKKGRIYMHEINYRQNITDSAGNVTSTWVRDAMLHYTLCTAGDSGGPVYCTGTRSFTSSSTTELLTTGIHKGIVKLLNDSTFSVCTKHRNIANAFNVFRLN